VKGTFFIVGPTAVGKSELAADVARNLDAEIVSADAFQIYGGLDLLTAKPDAVTLAKVPHHLIGTISILQEMNAAKFRQIGLRAIDEIHARGKLAIVVGGSGLYIKALTHGLDAAPSADPELRAQLNELTSDELREKLVDLDPETARKIDMQNRRRVVRALEICLLTDKPLSAQRMQAVAGVVDPGRPLSVPLSGAAPTGIFVFRNRDELRKRINQRVEAMFEHEVIGEVRAIDEIGATAAKMIGLREIREHLEGKMSILQCMEKIQGATRQYAKRQLTWFRHQTSFEPLNLSLLTHKEAVERISQRASWPGRAKG
jgi:tRNA dimethylallyltransferase